MTSYTVSQRTAEIGVRMALGAEPGKVRSMVVGQGLRLTAAGLVLGLAVVMSVGGVLGSLLYGVRRYDPMTLGGGVPAFLVVSLMASTIPASRPR